MKTLLCTLILLFSSGCASAPVRNFNSKTGAWDQIKTSGITADIEHNWFTGTITPHGDSFFDRYSERAVWWAEFSLWTFWQPEVLVVKWHDPSGNLFSTDECRLEKDLLTAACALKIVGTPAMDRPGVWTVQVFFRGNLIDTKRFQILGNANSAPPSVPASSDNFYQEHFEYARVYFGQQMYAEAEMHLKQILEREPSRMEARLALAAVYFKRREWDESLKELDLVVQDPAYRDRASEIRATVLQMKNQ